MSKTEQQFLLLKMSRANFDKIINDILRSYEINRIKYGIDTSVKRTLRKYDDLYDQLQIKK